MTKSAFRGTEVVSLRNIRVTAATEIEMDGPYAIKATGAGVRCGNHHRSEKVRHANTASVRACYQLSADLEAQSAAEIAAEQGYVRHLENAGWAEARLQDEMEARMGVRDRQGW